MVYVRVRPKMIYGEINFADKFTGMNGVNDKISNQNEDMNFSEMIQR